MKPITLDTKHFDYNNIQETLVAVPKSILREYFKMKDSVGKIVKRKEKKSPTWILTEEDILESGRQAMEDIKYGRTIDARELLKNYV